MDEKKVVKIPKHVGLILDGNRRWAKERNLPTLEGHRRGHDKVKLAAEWFFEKGVEIVSVFAFSTENWKRDRDEVNYLMKLFKDGIANFRGAAEKNGYRLLVSGRIEELPGDLPQIIAEAMAATKGNRGGIFNICLNYGGRAEIADAIKKMIRNGIDAEQVHEGMIQKYLYQSDLPDPDIIIRTSGEQRLSGFLLWECAYSELMFLKKFWPDFERTDVEIIIEEYAGRSRRFGANG